ncbi:MAG: PIG-L family deacetylase [Vicinamibacteria bacterium]|jgi:LmbE family N-acetylglucosaminyl deacetylase|nr:PIG-L family deacetylase [Vicinamibacteria bacterium]
MGCRIQFFSPHPDDIECFAGGVLLHHAARFDALEIVIMTRGERGSWNPLEDVERLKATRTREAEARAAQLPCVSLRWLDSTDGGVRNDPQVRSRIATRLREFEPEIIYLPERRRAWSFYWHADHLATGEIVSQAAREIRPAATLRHYHSRRGDFTLDVSPFFAESQRALRFYRSQYAFSARPPFLLYGIHALRRALLSRWARRLRPRCNYAEAFREDRRGYA